MKNKPKLPADWKDVCVERIRRGDDVGGGVAAYDHARRTFQGIAISERAGPKGTRFVELEITSIEMSLHANRIVATEDIAVRAFGFGTKEEVLDAAVAHAVEMGFLEVEEGKSGE